LYRFQVSYLSNLQIFPICTFIMDRHVGERVLDAQGTVLLVVYETNHLTNWKTSAVNKLV